MTSEQYVNLITSGHFLYWNMLGKLRGIENHNEDGLHWLSGDINFNYYTETADADLVVKRMQNDEIPKNLTFFTDDIKNDPTEPFKACGLFKPGLGTTGMAHELLDKHLPKADKRLNIYHVREIAQLKAAGAIFNSSFGYDLFSFEHYLEMLNIHGQYFYLAEYDGIPVGAVMSQHGNSFVYIAWVATLQPYRKRGIAGYLIQAAERDGIINGKTVGTLHARPGAVGAYRRIGYNDYCIGLELEFEEKEPS